MSPTSRSSLDEIDTPALILDRRRLDANLLRMREHVARLGASLRPHMKTAKSAEVARRALPQGGGITVSTLREAEYFFGHGYRDLFYAVGASPQKLGRAAALMRRGARLLLAVDQPEAARVIAEHGLALGLAFEAMIEIDCGDGRCGIDAQSSALLEVAAELRDGATLAGVFTHGGHSYTGRSPDELAAVAEQERLAVTAAASRLRAAGHGCAIVSMGSTPSVAHARDLSGITEVRAGIYMFGDAFQAGVGSCSAGDIAVSVLATVIGQYPQRDELIVDAGALALSKDISTNRFDDERNVGYGLVSGDEGLYVARVSQEHGVIRRRGGAIDFSRHPIGSRLRIQPNHACITAAAYDRYHVVDGDSPVVEAEWDRVNGW